MTDRPAAATPSPARRPADRLHLSPRHRAQLEALLREHLPDVEVWAYGSRITGASHDGSDLDLVLRAPDLRKIPIGRLSDLWEALRESTIPFLVEARDWARLPEEFHGKIERDYVVLVEWKQANSARSEDNSQERNPVIGTAVSPGWPELPFTDAVWVNPPVLLKYGEEYPFVDMAAIDVGSRQVYAIQHRKYSGGGSRFRNGDTLMARITPCLENGKIARYCSRDASETAHGSTEFIVIRGRPDVTDTEFSYYLTRWEEVRSYAVGQMTGTSGRQRVPTESLNHLIIPIPPLPEQRAIAHVLGALDDKIELNRRMNETLEAMARALFQSWFVDFDPVRARMEGGDTGLPADVADLFPSQLMDSDSDLIPAGWTNGHLSDIAVSPRKGINPEDLSSATPYIGLEHMPRHSIALAEWETAAKITSNKSTFNRGNILFGKLRPYFHKVGIAPVNGICSTDIMVIAPRVRMWHGFLLKTVSSKKFVGYADQTSTGTRMPRSNWKTMSNYKVTLPPLELAAKYHAITKPSFDRILANIHESRFLRSMRDSLLPELVSGTLQLGDLTCET